MRQTIEINEGWRFYAENLLSQPLNVNLPHTISVTPQNCSGGRNLQAQVFYERELFIPQNQKEKKLLLRLDGAMGTATLF